MSEQFIKQPENLRTTEWIDIGEGHAYKFTIWSPDFEIAENAAKWAHLIPLIRAQPIVGAIVRHRCPTETGLHEGSINFKTELTDAGPFKDHALWTVKSWSPLHIEPSLESHCPCKDHGHIRGDRWVRS